MSRKLRTGLMLLGTVLFCPPLSAQQTTDASTPIDECGTLVQGDNCVLYSGGSGKFVLADYGRFHVGDAVRVVGTIDPNCTTICSGSDGCILGAVLYDPAVLPCGTPIQNGPADIITSVCSAIGAAAPVAAAAGLWLTRPRRRPRSGKPVGRVPPSALGILLAASSVCLLTGCAAPENLADYRVLEARRAKLKLSDDDNRAKVAALAQRVQQAYAGIDSLSFRAEPVWEGKVRGQIEVAMARGRIKDRLYIDGQLAWVLTCRDGMIEEYKLPFRGVPEQYAARPAETPNGTHNVDQLEGIDEYGCMLGGYLETWVGQRTGKVNFYSLRIPEGQYLGQVTLRGQKCDLVLSPASQRFGGIELFYIRDDGFVLQNDTFWPDQADAAPRFARTRPFFDLSTRQLPDDTWRFERPAAVQAQPTSAAQSHD